MKPPYDDGDEHTKRPDIVLVRAVIAAVITVVVILALSALLAALGSVIR